MSKVEEFMNRVSDAPIPSGHDLPEIVWGQPDDLDGRWIAMVGDVAIGQVVRNPYRAGEHPRPYWAALSDSRGDVDHRRADFAEVASVEEGKTRLTAMAKVALANHTPSDVLYAAWQARYTMANRALSEHDFGDGVELVESGERWAFSSTGHEWGTYARVSYWQDDADDPRPSVDLTFKVQFSPDFGAVSAAFAVDSNGQTWCGRPFREAPTTLPPDAEGANDDRSGWAATALKAFRETTRCDESDVLADCLSDLMHYCDRNGMSFERELDRARRHYEEETREPAPRTQAIKSRM